MDNSNEPTKAPIDRTPQQEPAQGTTPVVPQQPKEVSRDKVKVAFVITAILLLVVMIPIAYMLGKNQVADDLDNSINTSREPGSDAEPIEEVEDASTEINDAYSGWWSTFENKVYGYSVKYPSDWDVKHQAMQGTSDWVSINPASEMGSGRADAVSIFTYFDGTGCPFTKTMDFKVGEHTVTGTACVEDDIYTMSMKHQQKLSAAGGVVLARTPDDMVGIRVDMGRGEDEIIRKILEGISGLTPYTH